MDPTSFVNKQIC